MGRCLILVTVAALLPYATSSATAAHGPGPKSTPLFNDHVLFTLGSHRLIPVEPVRERSAP